MKTTAKFLLLLLVFLVIFWLQTAVSFLLPFPFSTINIITVLLAILLLRRHHWSIVWLAFALFFFIELYTSSPFGVIIFSGTIGVLLTFWVYSRIFSNHSWYIAAAITATMLISYRLIYMVAIILLYWLNLAPWLLNINILPALIWELFLSVVASALISLMLSLLWPDKNKLKAAGPLFKV